jgi:Rrf2 family nitric oxide-sensitive transcriptional repressor
MYLATTTQRANIGDVARLYGISQSHVAKAVNLLARLGYVRSIRGIGGGIELAKRPEDIRIGDVVCALEGNMHLLECVGTENVCAIEGFCKLKTALAGAEKAQLDYLNHLSLQDVAPTARQLYRIA